MNEELQSLSLEELAGKAREGNIAAFERLYRLLFPLVLKCLLAVTRNHQDAEDLTQDLFSHLVKLLYSYDSQRPLKSWLLAVALNAARNYKKRESSGLKKVFEKARAEGIVNTSGKDNPGNPLIEKERNELMLSALRKLPSLDELCFILHHVEKLKIREISEIIGLPETKVVSRIRAAKRSLKRQLEGRSSWNV